VELVSLLKDEVKNVTNQSIKHSLTQSINKSLASFLFP